MIKAKHLTIAIAMAWCACAAHQAAAQEKFTITGGVRDRLTSAYVMNARVECLNEADSVVGSGSAFKWDYDYRRRAGIETGEFSFEIPRVKGHYTLRFVKEEYDTLTAPLDLTNMGARERDRALGTFYMDRTRTVALNEIEVTGSKVMFYNRGDTLVYNASAFDLADGSMLDALIEQLPGVELREGGAIYVNGKFVQSLLLNGKDFFKGDNQLMLENLAAYTVKDIEVYNKQTDRGRFLGRDDQANKEYVMDVKLKKEYIGGWIINAEAAGGTEERALGRLFAMNFTALSQYTLIANANNLNDDTKPTAEDKWDPDKQRDGVRRHIEAGFDYSTENNDATRKASGNLQYRQDRWLSESSTDQTSYLPEQNTLSSSIYNRLNRTFSLSTDHTLYWQSTAAAFTLKPRISLSREKERTGSESGTWLEVMPWESESPVNKLINSSLSKAFGKTDHAIGECNFDVTIKVPRTSDAIDLSAMIFYNASRDEQQSSRIIRYGDPTMPVDARHSLTDSDPSHQLMGDFRADYNLVLNGKLNFTFGYSGNLQRSRETSAYYLGMLDAGYTGDYTLEHLEQVKMDFDPLNSHKSLTTYSSHEASARFVYKLNDYWEIGGKLPIRHLSNRLDYRQNGVEYPASYAAWLFEPELSIRWSKYENGKNAQAYVSYLRYTNMPSLTSLITIPDTRNPLSQFVGNPDLKHATTDYFFIYLSKGNRNLTLYSTNNFTLNHNASASSYVYDLNSGKAIYQTVNINGDWQYDSNNYASYYWEKAKCNLTANFNFRHAVSHSMIGTNDVGLTRIRRINDKYSPSLGAIKYFGTHYSQRNNIKLTVAPEFTRSFSTNINDNNINPIDINFKLGGKFELPYQWTVSTSINLRTRRGYHTSAVKREEWIWNARVSKSFLKGNLLASLVAYDLLHQHQSIEYFVSSQSRSVTFTNTIPRYILLDLQYKINIMPKKKIEQRTYYY